MVALVKPRTDRRAIRRAGEAGKRTEYLAFRLAGETYAVQIAHVAEILRPPPITEVPRAPRTVLGVISVRGNLVTVVDLRRRVGMVFQRSNPLPKSIFDNVAYGLRINRLTKSREELGGRVEGD